MSKILYGSLEILFNVSQVKESSVAHFLSSNVGKSYVVEFVAIIKGSIFSEIMAVISNVI